MGWHWRPPTGYPYIGSTGPSPPPAKKLKQARLSFQALSPKPSFDNAIVNGATKKRKLSDGAVGPGKAQKTPKNEGKSSECVSSAENEVSSSSEAEPKKCAAG